MYKKGRFQTNFLPSNTTEYRLKKCKGGTKMQLKKVKMTNGLINTMAKKREQMFKGFTKEEVTSYIPVNKAYLYENATKTDVSMFIQSCVLCGGSHFHGNAGDGLYTPHCIDIDLLPYHYKIEIDRKDKDNQRLAEKYGI